MHETVIDFVLLLFVHTLKKKYIYNPAQNTIENGYNGNCIGFNGNYDGVYWYVKDYIGGMLNHIEKIPKTHFKNEFCNGFTGKS